MKEKLSAIRNLRNSKSFVLVTDEETILYVDLDSIVPAMQLVVLKELSRNLTKSIKQLESRLDGQA